MADDNNLRSYRSNDPHTRSASRSEGHDVAPGSDPLAELARLIGQNNPFAESARTPSRAASNMAEPWPMAHEAPVGDWRRHIERPNYQSMHDEPASDSHFPSVELQPEYPADPRGDYGHDPHAHDLHAAYPDETQFASPTDEYRDHRSYASAQPYDYADQSHVDPTAVPVAPGVPVEEGYDDPPHRQVAVKARTNWLPTAVMLVGCALIGATGAYGYRNLLKPASGAKPAPVIIADNAPSKIVPAAPDQKSSRSQDRLPGGSERLVSREEQPVVLQSPSQALARTEMANAAAAAQAIPPVPPSPAPVQAAPVPPPAASAPPQGTTAPKRIRTVTIRPEGGDSSARPVMPSARGASRSGPQTTAAVPQTSRTAPSVGRELRSRSILLRRQASRPRRSGRLLRRGSRLRRRPGKKPGARRPGNLAMADPSSRLLHPMAKGADTSCRFRRSVANPTRGHPSADCRPNTSS